MAPSWGASAEVMAQKRFPQTPVRLEMNKLVTFKQKMADGLMVAADSAGLVASLCGASVVAIFGKVMLAVVLGAVALGFFLRLVGRRRADSRSQPRTPLWCLSVAGVLAIVEVALLTEATNLPVRFHQPGFAPWHWLLVFAAVVIVYVVQVQLFRSWAWRRVVAPKR